MPSMPRSTDAVTDFPFRDTLANASDVTDDFMTWDNRATLCQLRRQWQALSTAIAILSKRIFHGYLIELSHAASKIRGKHTSRHP